MMEDILDELRLQQYSQLLSYGEELNCNIDLHEPDSSLMSIGGWSQIDEDIGQYISDTNSLYLRKQVELGPEQLPYWIVMTFAVNPFEHQAPELLQQVNKLRFIAELINDDYTQNLMLDGMAKELAIRYEELNVIYGLDQLSSPDTEIDEVETLRRVTENCLDYLSLDMAAVIIPGDDQLIFNIEESGVNFDTDSVVKYLNTKILNMVMKSGETLVINQDDVTDWTDLEMEVPIKIIASPIVSLNQNIIGVFIFTNHISKSDFTNSDRKLCDVFALEVGNIIQGTRDILTGLLNRRGLNGKLSSLSAEGHSKKASTYLLYLDVDQFTAINDTSGYSTGDKLLQHIATVLRSVLDESNTIARLATDEFVVLIKNCSEKKAIQIANKIQSTLKEIPYFSGTRSFEINLSIGIAASGEDQTNPNQLIQSAEIACQFAKKQGGDRLRVYTTNDQDLTEHQSIANSANQITEALENDRLILYAQAIKPSDTASNEAAHYEVLVRMLDEDDKVIPPGLFIPAAERYKMMNALDKRVIDMALAQLSAYNQLTNSKRIVLSINISGQSIGDDRFQNYVIKSIAQANVEASQLCFEITETAAISNLSVALNFIDRIRKIGCTFALDDFGAGMSSFNYLKHLSIDYLKIDGCFVKNILEEEIDAGMVEAMNNIAHAMKLKTVAEFVENSEIQAALVSMGVDYLQGYGLHKPEPLVDVLQAHAALPDLSEASG